MDPVYTKKIRKVEGEEPEAEDGNSNFEVSKEVAGMFNADWSDLRFAQIWIVTHKQKVTMMLLLSLGGAFVFPVRHAPESVLDFGDLYSFQLAPGKKEETLEEMWKSIMEMDRKIRV